MNDPHRESASRPGAQPAAQNAIERAEHSLRLQRIERAEQGARAAAAAADRDAPSTQVARDSDDYLGETPMDVGRRTGLHEYELFVSCNPAPAMQQQFEHHRPDFIAVHDVGTLSSRKLLQSLASANGRSTQKLVIRRQGYGTALATVHFVELPSSGGSKLRMYSTDCETEPSWRPSLAHMLLAFSRLGVIMVGELKAAEISSLLGRLRDSMLRGPWHNDQVLLLPLGLAGSLVNHGVELASGTALNVRTTPQVARATDAWGFISGAWNRLIENNPPAGPTSKPLSRLVDTLGAVTLPSVKAETAFPESPVHSPHSTVVPAPAVLALAAAASISPAGGNSGPAAARARSAAPGADKWPGDKGPVASARSAATIAPGMALTQPATAEVLRRYVRQVSEIGGVLGCTVFDAGNGDRIAHAGSSPSAAALAASGASLMSTILDAATALQLGRSLPEAAITLNQHHLLVRPLPRHAGLALHVLMDKAKANLTLVRLQVLRLDTLFEEPD